MRIGIDARFLGPEGTGLGRYVQELILNLEDLDKENEYIIFLRRENFDLYQPKNKNFKKVLADIRWYGLKEQITLPFIFFSQKLDFLHVPHFNIPVFYPGKIVVTIHDLIKSEFAGLSATTRAPFVYFLKHLGYERVIRIAISRAQKIFVPSKSIAKKLQKILHVPEEKIVVTYEAASLSDKLQVTSNKKVLEKYKIKKPYLLYVGNAYPYKNLDRLLLALKNLTSQISNLSLVNPCSRSMFYDRLGQKAKEMGLSRKVILPGYVPDQELAVLYSQAEAYVFPSLSEGFGIPGLDAMTLGIPVVCSDIPTLKEIYEDAALYFDPYSATDIAEKIKKVLEDQRLRDSLIENGKRKVQTYSWQKMAKETSQVYNSIKIKR
jgi:glycosyltransferase involved in cell wall biosynthesis